MIVETESGTRYEFDTDGSHVRRVPGDVEGELRRDDEWLELITAPEIVEGESMVLVFPRLSGQSGGLTFRTTSRVVSIHEGAT